VFGGVQGDDMPKTSVGVILHIGTRLEKCECNEDSICIGCDEIIYGQAYTYPIFSDNKRIGLLGIFMCQSCKELMRKVL